MYKYINLKRDNLLESRVYKYHSGLNNGTILRKLFLCVQMPKYLKRLWIIPTYGIKIHLGNYLAIFKVFQKFTFFLI